MTPREFLDSDVWERLEDENPNTHYVTSKTLEGTLNFAREYYKQQLAIDSVSKSSPIVKAFLKGNCPKCKSNKYHKSKHKSLPKWTCPKCDWKFDDEYIVDGMKEVDVIVVDVEHKNR